MDAERFYKLHREPYEKNLKGLEAEQLRLQELYTCIHHEGFAQIKTFFYKQRDEGTDDEGKHSDKPIFTIWMYLKAIWQGRQKKKDADRFLSWIESIPQQLQIVSEELNRLTKKR